MSCPGKLNPGESQARRAGVPQEVTGVSLSVQQRVGTRRDPGPGEEAAEGAAQMTAFRVGQWGQLQAGHRASKTQGSPRRGTWTH